MKLQRTTINVTDRLIFYEEKITFWGLSGCTGKFGL